MMNPTFSSSALSETPSGPSAVCDVSDLLQSHTVKHKTLVISKKTPPTLLNVKLKSGWSVKVLTNTG